MKVKERNICINGVPIVADGEVVKNENAVMVAYAGSTGLCGGDRRKGGRTYVSLKNLGETDMIVTLTTGKNGNGTGFEIAASGDAELLTIALAFSSIAALLVESITEKAMEEEEE